MRNLGILEKIRTGLEEAPYDAVLLFGADSVRYLTGAVHPFLHPRDPGCVSAVCPRDGDPVIFAPGELRDSIKQGGRIGNVRAYSAGADRPENPESRESAIAAGLKSLGLEDARIGVTEERIPAGLYRALKGKLPAARFTACGDWLSGLRMVKTAGEQALLEDAAFRTDHGLAGAAHHVMVYAERREKGLSEIIRIHCIERGLDMTGYESLAVGASGDHAALPWPEAPFFGVGLGKRLAEGELVRMEIRTSRDGYWSDASRPLTMGPPSHDQKKACGQVAAVRNTALKVLRQGRSCSAAAQSILEFCASEGIETVREHGLGHGIGVMPVEPPFIDLSDGTVLRNGMVLVLTHTVRGPSGELVRSYDTVVVGETESRIAGRYKMWDEPYKAVLSYQHGGG